MKTTRILKIGCIGAVTVVVLLVILVGGLLAFSGTLAGVAPAPFQLARINAAPQAANSAPPDGTWVVGDGSSAGFRVGVGLKSTIVGRTSAVSGSLVVANNAISAGSFQVDLNSVTIGGKQNPGFLKLLETGVYPSATISITRPIPLPAIPTGEQSISFQAPVSLTIHGITREVTLTVMARDTGDRLEAAGSAPLVDTDWNVKSPFAVNGQALIEFLLVLQRR